MKKLLIIIISFLFTALLLTGAKIGGPGNNTLRVGTKAGVDIEIQMGDGRIKWDDAASKVQFSNDLGVSFKDIGAGGGAGAGTNLIAGENNDFESGDPPANWTASAGTFIASVGEGFGNQAGSWDSAAGSDTLDSTVKAVKVGLENRSCNATIQYKYVAGSGGDYKLQAVATSAGLLAEIDLAVSTDWRKAAVQFTCPSSDSVKVRIISTVDGGIILVDDATIGKSDFVDISQTELVAHAFYPFTANCLWTTASSSFADFSTVAACPSISVVSSTQAVDTTDNDLPDIDFDNLLPGNYIVTATALLTNNTGALSGGIRISDGTTSGAAQGFSVSTVSIDGSSTTVQASFTYTTSAPRNFKIQGASNAANMLLANDLENSRELTFTVVRYPLSSAEAITLETVGEHWDVNIGGSNPDLGTSDLTVYTEIIDAGLDMVLNTGTPAGTQIPCSTTNPSTGLTCAAGSESLGIVIDITENGRYKACLESGHQITGDAAGFAEIAFQWVETPNNAQNILQEGNSRVVLSGDNSSTLAQSTQIGINICGYFTFTSIGKKTLRFMREQDITATISTNAIFGDRSAAVGQRDIHITVEKLSEQKPAPTFTELQNLTKGGAKKKSCTFMFGGASVPSNCTAACTVQKDLDGCISSVTRNGTGDYTIAFNSGFFPLAAADGDVICTSSAFISGIGSANASTGNYTISGNNITLLTFRDSTSATADAFVQTTCEGAR